MLPKGEQYYLLNLIILELTKKDTPLTEVKNHLNHGNGSYQLGESFYYAKI